MVTYGHMAARGLLVHEICEAVRMDEDSSVDRLTDPERLHPTVHGPRRAPKLLSHLLRWYEAPVQRRRVAHHGKQCSLSLPHGSQGLLKRVARGHRLADR